MEKIVVLNSGGFDSTVLLHFVRDNYPDAEIYSLHFSYGQRSEKEELKWSEYNAEKVGAKIKNINLPMFSWTTSNFYNVGYEYETQYLEWRNLIFLSYALSYASSIGATKIFCAFLKSYGYKDTSKDFIHTMNLIDKDIEIIAPFFDVESKEDLTAMAFSYGIKPNTFNSCDVLYQGEPCGKCPDCKALEYINEELTLNAPIKIYRHCKTAEGKEFNNLCLNTTAWELRVLWNDDCQLNCAHCFYGDTVMKGIKLYHEEFLDVVKQAFELGIPSIHIAGKEPLYDDSVIKFISDVNELRKNYSHIKHPLMPKGTFLSIVTNGINVPRFAKDLKEAGLDKIFISVDDIIGKETSSIRVTSNKVAFNAIDSALEVGLELEIFINIHEKNYDRLPEIIRFLEVEKGLKTFYLAIPKNIGNGKNIPRLNIKEMEIIINSLIKYVPVNNETSIGLGFGIYYTNLILSESQQLSNILYDIKNYGNDYLTEWFYIRPEFYCSTYIEQITLSPDGYILGCASDVCRNDYDKISAGNIRNLKLKDIIKIGKLNRNFNCNTFKHNPNCFKGCPHEFNY